MVIPFIVSYLHESGFSAMAMIKTKYQPRIYLERKMWLVVSQILPRFDDFCTNKQASSHIAILMHIFFYFINK